MLDSTKRLQRAIAAGVLRTCTRCGAPEGHRITRFEKDPERWSLDLSLHFNASDVWRRPSKVVLKKSGLCAWCAEPFRGALHPMSRQPFITCKVDGREVPFDEVGAMLRPDQPIHLTCVTEPIHG